MGFYPDVTPPAVPTGSAGGVLTGTYPNPGLNEAVTQSSPALLTQLGIQGWTYPSFMSSSGGQAFATAGVVYLSMLFLPNASTTITNVLYSVGVAGSTLTAAENFVGVYSNVGALIGTSADQTTNFGATGFKTAALAGGPFTGTWPYVYVALLWNGSTGPGLCRGIAPFGNPTMTNLNAATAGLLSSTVDTAQTTLPPSFTVSGISGTTATPQYVWFGLS